MALHKADDQKATVSQNEQVAPPQQPQRETQYAEANETNNIRSLFGNSKIDDMRFALLKPLGGSGVNEKITKLHQMFVNIYEERKRSDPNIYDVKFTIANPSRVGNLYGGIVVSIAVRTTNGVAIGAHLMVVESSIRPKKQEVIHQSNRYVIHNVASNTVAPDTATAVEHLVRHSWGYQDAIIVDAGFSIVPEEVTLSDDLVITDLLDNAAGAALTRLQLATGSTEGDVALMVAKAITAGGVSTQAYIEEHPGRTVDIANQPIRSDFVIKTIATENGSQNEATQQALDIGSVNVFCTPVYSPSPAQYLQNGQVIPGKQYYNQVVIKDIKTGPDVRLAPSTLFMLIGTTGLLATNGLWKRKYIPNMSIPANKLDIGDIGAFGYECPHMSLSGKPEMIPTKTNEFTSERFNKFMNSLFHEQLVYQIDVPDGHHLLGILLAEANDQQAARNIIYDIINLMTGNEFGKRFNPTDKMFIARNVRVINGYYTNNETGEDKPLDTIDYLAMLNLTNGDALSIQQFESSFSDTQNSSLNMAIRTAFMEELTNNTMKVRSYSTRLTISPQFMEALINSLKAARLFPEATNGFAQQQVYTRPGSDYWARFAVDPNHLPNLTGGYGNYSAGQYGHMAQSYMPNFNSFR